MLFSTHKCDGHEEEDRHAARCEERHCATMRVGGRGKWEKARKEAFISAVYEGQLKILARYGHEINNFISYSS